MGKPIEIKQGLDLPVAFSAIRRDSNEEFANARYEHNQRVLIQSGVDPVNAQAGARLLEDAARDAHNSLLREARRDSATQNAGIFGSRELEYRDPVTIKELFPKLCGLNIFRANPRGLTFGAKSWRVKRVEESGQPKVFGSQGNDVPKVELKSSEETGLIQNYVIGIEYSLFDEAAAGFANISLISDKMAAARRRMAKFASDRTLFEADDLVTILNHPYFTRLSYSTTFKSAGNGEAMLAVLESIVTAPTERLAGNDQLAPNNIWMSPRMFVTIKNTRVHTSADAKTVLEKFKDNNPEITINIGQDLSGAGTDGRDIILAVNDSLDSGSNLIVRDFTSMPLEIRSFMREQDAYMTHGGVRSDYPIGNVIAEVNYSR